MTRGTLARVTYTTISGDTPSSGRLTRQVLIALTAAELLVAAYLGVKLYFFTESARSEWMWAITPFNTRFLGAVYLTAIAPVGLRLRLLWRGRDLGRDSLGPLIDPILLVFGAVLLAVSLAYLDRFRFDSWSRAQPRSP